MTMPPVKDPLQAALDTAFTRRIALPSSRPTSVDLSSADLSSLTPPVPAPTPATALSQSVNPDELGSSGVDPAWKEGYEAYVADWRKASAAARQKAEETRLKYEGIRAQEEKQEEEKRQSLNLGTAHDRSATVTEGRQPLPNPPQGSPSVADARDLVTGEVEGQHKRGTSGYSPPVSISHWEEVPSLASSFPSLPSHASPPSRHQDVSSNPPSSIPEEKEPSRTKDTKAPMPGPSQARAIPSSSNRPQPPAVTPLVLNTSLSKRTRVFALVSSLAINMFLPFINGVMLGFGEIFARNVIGPIFGWAPVITPGSGAVKPKVVSVSERERLMRREEYKRRAAENPDPQSTS